MAQNGAAQRRSALHELLSVRPKEWLVDQLVQAAESDPALKTRLEASVAPRPPNHGKVARLRTDLATAIEVEETVDRRHRRRYLDGIRPVLGELERFARRHPEPAIEVAEYALGLMEDAYGRVDDPDGGLAELAAWAHEIHLAASRAARPEPAEFGARLARIALDLRAISFLNLPDAYDKVLGDVGRRAFAKVIDDRWRRLPVLTSGTNGAGSEAPGGQRQQVTALKLRLAGKAGPDAVVEVLARDLSRPSSYRQAALVLADAGRLEDALEWTERGLAAFDHEPHSGLWEQRAELLRRLGRAAPGR
jgi:hypothetical protein